MCAAAAALTAFEISIGAGGTTLSRPEHIIVHRETHRTPRLSPFEPGLDEDTIEAFALRVAAHLTGTRHDHRAHVARHGAAGKNACRGAQIFDSPVGA